ncbi:MAG: hypothetical protein WBS22_09570 [Methylocystis sp.]
MCLLDESQGHLPSRSAIDYRSHHEAVSAHHRVSSKEACRRLAIIILALTQCLAFCDFCYSDTLSPDFIQNGFTSVYAANEDIPPFPEALAGWKQTPPGRDFWGEAAKSSGVVHVGEGNNEWTHIPEFLPSQNDCDTGIFLVRWKTKDTDAAVDSGLLFATAVDDVKSGSFGFLGGSNCHEPIFRFKATNNRRTHNNVDIIYEVRFYDSKKKHKH